MKRQQMIEILIENRFGEWIYARCTDSLEEVLRIGWRGFDEYTNRELKEALEDVDIKECQKLIEQGHRRGGDFDGMEKIGS